MNITQEKIDELNSILKIEVTEDDYQQKVDKVLKDYQKKMNLPGFRPGKVPFTVVKKMYGKAMMVDEINKVVIDSMYNYFDQNKIDVLGNPLPNKEKSTDIDWDTQKNFEFFFDIGLKPEFETEALENLKIKLYDIKVNDAVVDKYLYDIRRRFGKYSNPEVVSYDDLVYCDIEELDKDGNVKDNGIKNKSSVALDLIKDFTEKDKIVGLKKDDVADIDIFKAFEDHHEISHILAIEEAKVKELNKVFRIKVIAISHVELAEINQELFEKVYKADKIETEEQLKERIKQDAKISFTSESEKKFVSDVVEALLKKAKINLPDAFLKRWLLDTNRDKFTEEQVEKEYSVYSETLKWQLIENKILKENNIEVTKEDVKDYIKDYFRKTVASDESNTFPEERLNELAERMLQNKDEVKRIYDKLYDDKLKDLFKSKVKMTTESVSYEDFNKLASDGHDHEHKH
ncbi:MAG: trigger factor [Bacteroidales bacterium]|jgi:trigger factor